MKTQLYSSKELNITQIVSNKILENSKLIDSNKLEYPKYWKLYTTKWKEIIIWWDSFTKVAISIWRDIFSKNDIESKEKIDYFNKLSIRPDLIVDVSTYEEEWNELYKYLCNNFDWIVWISPHLWLSHNKKWTITKEKILERLELFWKLWVWFIYIMPHINIEIIEKALKIDRLATTSLSWGVIIRDMLKYWVNNVYSECYEQILEICKKYKIWIALAWVFRPSNLQESLDEIHLDEIKLQNIYIEKTINAWVTIIRQWVWHMPLVHIKKYVDLINEYDIPYMPLWPMVSDYISVWYDTYSNVIWAYEFWRYWKANIINAITDEEHTWWIPAKDSAIRWYISARIAWYLINSIIAPDQIIEFEKSIANMKNIINTCKMSWNPILNNEIYSEKACSRCWVWTLCPCNIKDKWIENW